MSTTTSASNFNFNPSSFSPSSILNSNSIFNINSFNLPSNTRVNWTRWSASNPHSLADTASSTPRDPKGKGKQKEHPQPEVSNGSKFRDNHSGEASQPEGAEPAQIVQQADKAPVEALMGTETEAEDQHTLASSWSKLNRWQKLKRRDQNVMTSKESIGNGQSSRDPVKDLLQPVLYLPQFDQPSTTTTTTETATASQSSASTPSPINENDTRSSLPPKVNGKRKVRGGDIAEKSGSDRSDHRDSNPDASDLDTTNSNFKSFTRRRIKSIWCFEITWEEENQGEGQIKPIETISSSRNDPLSVAERERSAALEALKELRNISTGSYALSSVYRDAFWSSSSLASTETILPNPESREPNFWLMKSLAARSADDLAYYRAARQANSFVKDSQLDRDVHQSNVADLSNGSPHLDGETAIVRDEGQMEKNEEDGEEGEWNEDEKEDNLDFQANSRMKTSNLEISDRRVVRMGDGVLLLPRTKDRPSRAPPPPAASSLFPGYSSLTYAQFKVYVACNSLVVQLLPRRRALSPIRTQTSKSGEAPGTALILAPFEQAATFVCSLSALNLNVGSSSKSSLGESDSGSDSDSGSESEKSVRGEDSNASNPATSPLEQIGETLRLELEQVGIYDDERYLQEDEWIVCRLERDASDLASQKHAEISSSSLSAGIEEGSFLWPVRFCFLDLESSLAASDSQSSQKSSPEEDHPSQSKSTLKFLSLTSLSSKTSHLLKLLSASGSRLMASAASPMPSLFNGASASTTGPSPSTSAFTPGPASASHDGIATPAASHLSAMTPAFFSMPTPSNPLQSSDDQRAEENKSESKEEEQEGDDDSGGDLDLWGGELEDSSEDGAADPNENFNQNLMEDDQPKMDSTEENHHVSIQNTKEETGQDEEMNGSIVSGNDYEGLVTEDDFSFFDGGAFDFPPMEIDQNIDGNSSTADPNFHLDSIFNHQGDQAQSHQMQHSDSNQGNPISLPTDTPQGNNLSTSASTSSGDPPSLPGFTPSSLTGSSPAFANGAGTNAKTPRTPFSPYNEFNEPVIVGENDLNHMGMGMGHYRERTATETQESFENSISGDDIGHGREESQEISLPKVGESDGDLSSRITGRGVRDLGNKYEFGKFAVSLQEFNGKIGGGVGRRRPTSNGATSTRRRGGRSHLVVGPPSFEGNAPTSTFPFNSNSIALKSFFNPQSSSMPPLHKLRLTERGVLPGTGVIRSGDDWTAARLDDVRSDAGMTEDSASETSSSREESSEEESEDESDDEKEEMIERLVKTSKRFLDSLTTSPPSSISSPTSSTGSPTSSSKKSELQLDHLAEGVLKGIFRRSDESIVPKTQGIPPVTSASHLKDLFATTLVSKSLSQASSKTEAHRSNRALIEVLEPPKVMVGCQGAVVQFEPTVLRFWDKLALTPSSGQKPVSAFYLQLESSELDSVTSSWFSRVSQAYQLFGLGSHHFESVIELGGQSSDRSSDLTEFLTKREQNEDTWEQLLRKVLRSVEPILSKGQHVVLYALQEESSASSIYHQLQKDLRKLAQSRIGLLSNYLTVVAMPSAFPTEATSNSLAISLWPRHPSPNRDLDMRRFVFRLYNILDRKVRRTTMKVVREDPREEEAMIQYPAFTLSDDPLSVTNSIQFRLDRPPSTALGRSHSASAPMDFGNPDVMTRGMLLLIAYDFSSEEIATASVIDARGQGQDLHVWNRKDSLKEDVIELWKFVLKFARRANVLWRIVLSRMEGMDEVEVKEWSRLAQQGLFQDAPAIDLTLSCVEIDFPLAFLPGPDGTSSRSSNQMASGAHNLSGSTIGQSGGSGPDAIPAGAVYFDSSQTTFALYPRHRLEVPSGTKFDSKKVQLDQAQDSLLALKSSLIVRLPRDSDLSMSCSNSGSRSSSSPHSMGIHLLQIFNTSSSEPDASSSSTPEERRRLMTAHLRSRLRDITRSFNALQLLTLERGVANDLNFSSSVSSIPTLRNLPWHVAILLSVKEGSLHSI